MVTVGMEQHEAQLLTDEQVATLVLGGEKHLFEVIMRRNNRRIFRALRAILRTEADVEDAMQEAYVNAFVHLRDFSGRAKLSTWLTRIAVNEGLARLRKRRRFSPLDDEAEAKDELTVSNIATPEQGASDRELGVILEEAIDGLPLAFRSVFVLRAVEGMSGSETAEALEIPEETVKTRLHRARGLLQLAVADRIGAAVPCVYEFHLSRCDRVVAAVLQRIGAAR